MKVYVAAKFEEKGLAKTAQRILVAAGHEITHDWTEESSDGLSGQERLTYFATHAQHDLNGVLAAEAFLLLHHHDGRGLFVELGAALANPGCVVVVVSELDPSDRRCPIFYFHPRVFVFSRLEEAVAFITAAGRKEWHHGRK